MKRRDEGTSTPAQPSARLEELPHRATQRSNELREQLSAAPAVRRDLPDVAGRSLLTRIGKRVPLSIEDRDLLLPRPPPLSLYELGLNIRTMNCLRKAGYEDNPATLGDVTVGEIMELPAFGVGCLESYLRAAEQWKAAPLHLTCNSEPKPGAASRRPIEQDYLRSLIALARRGEIESLGGFRLVDPHLVDVKDLLLQTRTRNCLRQWEGEGSPRLGELTIGELLATQSFGRTSLLDLLQAILQTYAYPPQLTSHASSKEQMTLPLNRRTSDCDELAERIEAVLPVFELSGKDRRFGRALRRFGVESTSGLLAALRGNQKWSVRTLKEIERLIVRIEAATRISLEQEAVQLRRGAPGSRCDRMLRTYLASASAAQPRLSVWHENGRSRANELVRFVCRSPSERP